MTILEKFSLRGHRALVTGAGRGIGKGIALALADAGADIACAARTQRDIDAVADAIRDRGRNAIAVSCNVAKDEQRQQLIDTCAEKLGGLSILVNNAGGSGPNDPLETSASEFASALSWNVVPAFDLTRAAVPHLRNSAGASVINISSAVARLPQKNFSAYGTAKAALSHLTRMLAQDLAPDIRVNAIECGPIATEALEQYMTPEMRAHMIAGTPLNRLGEVTDVAATSVFLASAAAAWISGKIIEVDGGTESAW